MRLRTLFRPVLFFAGVGPAVGTLAFSATLAFPNVSAPRIVLATLPGFVLALPLGYMLQAVPFALTGAVAGALCSHRTTLLRATLVVLTGAISASWMQWEMLLQFDWSAVDWRFPASGAIAAAVSLLTYVLRPSSRPARLRDPFNQGDRFGPG